MLTTWYIAGLSGLIVFNGNGDVTPTYWIQDFKNASGVSRIIGIFDLKNTKVNVNTVLTVYAPDKNVF